MARCRSYLAAAQFCRDGFFQLTGFCSGKSVGCPTCGAIKSVPDCLLDEPRHFVKKEAV